MTIIFLTNKIYLNSNPSEINIVYTMHEHIERPLPLYDKCRLFHIQIVTATRSLQADTINIWIYISTN